MSDTTMGTCDDCGGYGAVVLYDGSIWLCRECLRAARKDDGR